MKVITQFQFVQRQPPTSLHGVVPAEYDFAANVNPTKPHVRWSQARAQIVHTGEVVPARLHNSYGKYVSQMYN